MNLPLQSRTRAPENLVRQDLRSDGGDDHRHHRIFRSRCRGHDVRLFVFRNSTCPDNEVRLLRLVFDESDFHVALVPIVGEEDKTIIVRVGKLLHLVPKRFRDTSLHLQPEGYGLSFFRRPYSNTRILKGHVERK